MIINYTEVCNEVAFGNAIKATKYVSPKLIIRAVRKRFHKKILKGNIEISLTIGKPNYAEREFIKLCQKANEVFPIKKIQIKPYEPKPRKLNRKNQ